MPKRNRSCLAMPVGPRLRHHEPLRRPRHAQRQRNKPAAYVGIPIRSDYGASITSFQIPRVVVASIGDGLIQGYRDSPRVDHCRVGSWYSTEPSEVQMSESYGLDVINLEELIGAPLQGAYYRDALLCLPMLFGANIYITASLSDARRSLNRKETARSLYGAGIAAIIVFGS